MYIQQALRLRLEWVIWDDGGWEVHLIWYTRKIGRWHITHHVLIINLVGNRIHDNSQWSLYLHYFKFHFLPNNRQSHPCHVILLRIISLDTLRPPWVINAFAHSSILFRHGTNQCLEFHVWVLYYTSTNPYIWYTGTLVCIEFWENLHKDEKQKRKKEIARYRAYTTLYQAIPTCTKCYAQYRFGIGQTVTQVHVPVTSQPDKYRPYWTVSGSVTNLGINLDDASLILFVINSNLKLPQVQNNL